jgi:hypothetical protein
MIGLTVCVDYGDLLAVTLPRNARGFERRSRRSKKH